MATATSETRNMVDSLFNKPPAPPAATPPAPASDPAPVPDSPLPQISESGIVTRPSDDGAPPTDLMSDALTPPPSTEEAEPADPDIESKYPDPKDVKSTSKESYAWKALKTEAKQALAQAKEERKLRREVEKRITQAEQRAAEAEARSKVGDPVEIEQLRAELNDAQAKLARFDLASTKSFRTKYDSRMEELASKGALSLTKYGKVDPNTAKTVMEKLSDPNVAPDVIEDTLAGLPQNVSSAVMLTLQDIHSLAEQRSAELGNWKESQAKYRDEESRQASASLNNMLATDVPAIIQQLQKEGSWAFIESKTDAKWNAAVRERLDAVRGVLKSPDQKTLIKYAAEGVAANTYKQFVTYWKTRAEKAESELHTVQGGTPSMRGAAPQARVSAEPKKVGDEPLHKAWLREKLG